MFPVNRFTDPTAAKAYVDAIAAREGATTPEAVSELKASADGKRDKALARGDLLEAACTYLVMAQRHTAVDGTDPEKLYHFAANAFRDLGLLQRAAECYFNAAMSGFQKYSATGTGDASFARRSAGRAKSMFADLGDDDNSDNAHVLQQKIRSVELRRDRNYLLASIYFLWEAISRFGTDPARWATSLLIAIVAFAVIYPLLIQCGSIVANSDVQRSGAALWTSSLYFSVGNLLQFGTLGTLTPKSGLAHITAVLHAVVAFILLGTGATFLTRR